MVTVGRKLVWRREAPDLGDQVTGAGLNLDGGDVRHDWGLFTVDD